MKRLLLFLFLFLPLSIHAQKISLDSIKAMTPAEGLFYALEYYGVYEPHIVYAQAVLETGHFKSYLAKKGNLFGIYDSRRKQYRTFSHWIESVKDYRDAVQSKYKGGDYYTFLENLPYASDPDYITKLRKIARRYIQYD